MTNYIRYRGHLYRQASNTTVPTSDTNKTEDKKAQQSSPAKRVPDPTIGDDPGEFIVWVKTLFEQPIPAKKEPPKPDQAESMSAEDQAAAAKAAAEAAVKNEKIAVAKVEAITKARFPNPSDSANALKILYAYVSGNKVKSLDLSTPKGRAAFAQFVASVRVLKTFTSWLNDINTVVRDLKL